MVPLNTRKLLRVTALIAAGLAGVLVIGAIVTNARRDRSPQAARSYLVELIGTRERAEIWIDPRADAVVVRGAATEIAEFALVDGVAYVPVVELVDDYQGPEWVALPPPEELTALLDLDRLFEAFDLDAKDCVLPDEFTDRLVKVLVAQTFDPGQDRQRYNVCGEGIRGGAFADGSSVAIEPHLVEPSEVKAFVGDVIDAPAIGLTTTELRARLVERLVG